MKTYPVRPIGDTLSIDDLRKTVGLEWFDGCDPHEFNCLDGSSFWSLRETVGAVRVYCEAPARYRAPDKIGEKVSYEDGSFLQCNRKDPHLPQEFTRKDGSTYWCKRYIDSEMSRYCEAPDLDGVILNCGADEPVDIDFGGKGWGAGAGAGLMMTTGKNNIAIGSGAGSCLTTASNCTYVGGVAGKGRETTDDVISIATGETERIVFDGKNYHLPSLPKQDPEAAGALWNNKGAMRVSAGKPFSSFDKVAESFRAFGKAAGSIFSKKLEEQYLAVDDFQQAKKAMDSVGSVPIFVGTPITTTGSLIYPDIPMEDGGHLCWNTATNQWEVRNTNAAQASNEVNYTEDNNS